MSRVMNPLSLSVAPLPVPRRSLGPRRARHAIAHLQQADSSASSSNALNGKLAAVHQPQAGAITTFFKVAAAAPSKAAPAQQTRVPLTDRSNAQLTFQTTPPDTAAAPECTPPVSRALFDCSQESDTESSQHTQGSAPLASIFTATAAAAAAASAGAGKSAASAASHSSCWDSTPPEQAAAALSLLPAAAVPAVPAVHKAPRKPTRRSAPAASRPASPSFRPEIICLIDSLDSNDARANDSSSGGASAGAGARDTRPCPLNFSSQPDASQPASQQMVTCSPLPLADDTEPARQGHFPLFASFAAPFAAPAVRSTSACSDVHIQASDDELADDTADSGCPTPVLTTPQLQPQHAPTNNFAAFNESISAAAATANPSHRSSTLSTYTDMPPPSLPTTRMLRSTSSLQRGGSFAGSNSQSGLALPPPGPARVAGGGAPSLSSSQQPMIQTNLDFMRTNSGAGGGGSLSRYPSFTGGSQQQLQASSQSFNQSQNEGTGNSLDSQSMYCTPQDQPVRERTLMEMSEDLHSAREGLALAHTLEPRYLQVPGAAAAPAPFNTHAALASTGRVGSSSNNSSAGLHAPPSKKARMTRGQQALTALQPSTGSNSQTTRGLGSMQELGSTLPADSQPSLSQQMTQMAVAGPAASAAAVAVAVPAGGGNHCAPPFIVENPFVTSLQPPHVRAAAAAAAASASARATGKKRALPGASSSSSTAAAAAAAATASSLASSASFLLSHFEYVRQFGVGSFGSVMLVRHKLDQGMYVVKKSKARLKGPQSSKLLLREVHAMTFLKQRPHFPPSLLRLEHSWVEDHFLHMQLEYCEGGSLATVLQRHRDGVAGADKRGGKDSNLTFTSASASTFIPSTAAVAPAPDSGDDEEDDSAASGPFPEPVLLQVALQMGQALAFMHTHHLAHLDVKPDNMLHYSDALFKLADFGLTCSTLPSQRPASLEVGDRRYLAPEALDEFVSDLPALDCFALGCSLYELACGLPFALPLPPSLQDRLRNGDIDDIVERISPPFFEAIRAIMHPDPAQRANAQQFVQQLQTYCM